MAYKDLEKKRRTRAAYYEKHRDGYVGQWRANSAKYRAKNREAIRAKKTSPEGKAQRAAYMARPEVHARQRLFARTRRYGLTPEGFRALVELQAGLCAMCTEPMNPRKTQIDHDHACCPGKRSCGRCVRGLLCVPCNLALGVVENADLVARGQAYLEVFDQRAPAL
jgi:hypothetical protein